MIAICIFMPNLTSMTNFVRPFLIASIALTSLFVSFAAYAQGDAKAKLDEYLKLYDKAGKLSGHMIVEQDGKVLFEKSYGAATQRFDVANNKATVFKLGKASQPLISWVVMKAYAEGVLDIDKPITTYIAEYPNEMGQKIKLIHLLGHTSGLPDFTTNELYFEKHTCGGFDTNEFIKDFCSKTPSFAAGSKYSFSYTNYYLLGVVLERVYQKDLATIINEKLSSAVGMKSTGLLKQSKIVKGLADGHAIQDGELENPMYINIDFVGGAAGMYSSVVDLMKFLDYLATDDVASQKQNSVLESLGGKNMLGWDVTEVFGHKRKTVSGAFNGFSAVVDLYPDDNIKVIFLSNYEFAPIGRIAADVPCILFGQPYLLPGKLDAKTTSSAALMKYSGEYTLTNEAGDFPMSVVVEGDALKVGDSKNGFTKLNFVGDDYFFIDGQEGTLVRFNYTEDKVVGFSIITDTKLVSATKK